jgi:hypothetical protein
MLWLFEGIAGFETLPSKLTQWYLRLNLVEAPTGHQGQPASLIPSRRWQSNMDRCSTITESLPLRRRHRAPLQSHAVNDPVGVDRQDEWHESGKDAALRTPT